MVSRRWDATLMPRAGVLCQAEEGLGLWQVRLAGRRRRAMGLQIGSSHYVEEAMNIHVIIVKSAP